MLEAIEIIPLCAFAVVALLSCAYFAYKAFPWFVGASILIASMIFFEGFEGLLTGVFWGFAIVLLCEFIKHVPKAVVNMPRKSIKPVTLFPLSAVENFYTPESVPCIVCGKKSCAKLTHVLNVYLED